MSLFGFFGKKVKTPAQIEKQVRKAKEAYAQPDYRRMAMEKLFDWGSDEALEGLLQRFTVVVQSPHWDEIEKKWLVEELVLLGDKAKKALILYINKEANVNYPISALFQLIKNKEEFGLMLETALLARSPEDYRSAKPKQELIAAFGQYELKDRALALLPYLEDHSDDVQCITMDILIGLEDSVASASIGNILTDDSHSARVLRHAAHKIFRNNISLPKDLKLPNEVQEDYIIENGHLKPSTT